jgi:hypothetical protein
MNPNFGVFFMYAEILSASSQNTQKEWRIRRKKFLLSTMPDEVKGQYLEKIE